MFLRFLIALVLLGIVVGGIVGFNRFRDGAIEDFFANQAPPALPVDTVVAEAAPWVPALEAIGTIDAIEGIELAVEVGGIVQEMGFAANDRVEQGQPLIRLDDEVERADLAAAAAAAELAEQTLARARSLGDRGIATTASIEEAQASLASARAQAQRIEALINQKMLLAPFSGEIGIPAVEAGQFVTAGSPIATLQNSDTLRVDFTLPEQDLPRIAIGQAVEIAAETGGASAAGAITAIEPRVDPATRLVSVRAELRNEDRALSPGQFARVRVILPAQDGVVALPQSAVVTSLYGDYVYAVVAVEGADAEAPQRVARQVFVQAGARQADRVEIAEGVSPGDVVVVAGQNRLSNGTPVRLEGAPEGGAAPGDQATEAPPTEPGSGTGTGTGSEAGTGSETGTGAGSGSAQAAEVAP